MLSSWNSAPSDRRSRARLVVDSHAQCEPLVVADYLPDIARAASWVHLQDDLSTLVEEDVRRPATGPVDADLDSVTTGSDGGDQPPAHAQLADALAVDQDPVGAPPVARV